MPLLNNQTNSEHLHHLTMDPHPFPIPPGVHALPKDSLDLRPDAEIDQSLLDPGPVTGEKNIWFFWHSGFTHMHPYAQRNIRAWHRRFTNHGWTVRVVDRQPGSPLNISNFLDISDPGTFPKAFLDGTVGGDYAPQHTSDLVRWPLLLRYGGVYADVGMMQIGDLDALWSSTVGDPDSPYEILTYNASGGGMRSLTNYFLASGRDNPFFERCHRLFLELWASDGGKTSTEGMHASPLLKDVPLMGASGLSFKEGDRTFSEEDVSKMLTDYIIQGQCMTLVMGLEDEEEGWNGPEYVKKHVYGIEFTVGSQLINELTAWNGDKAFELLSLPIPKDGEAELAEQREAREIVEQCLRRSYGFKLAHGLILRVIGNTLGSLWRKNTGADVVPGTYAAWLRYGMIYWCQDEIPPKEDFRTTTLKKGPLLREA
ncbi:hypothetical protein B0O99DRAFT_608114 [Bisporella sp. PMI_857]|nr:hypothetical protein B0O99DRAFT_608114 [Bisporella sp. PMI_857]